jgi:DNA-binding MarR family transcriptional regulator
MPRHMKSATFAESPESVENHLAFALYAAAHAFTKAYSRLLAPFALTYPQYLVMLVLWEHEGLTVKDLGQRLFLDTGTLTPLLKRLEVGGRLNRRRDAVDERQMRVTLTPHGRGLQSSTAAVRCAVERATGITASRLEQLRHDAMTARRALEEGREATGWTA